VSEDWQGLAAQVASCLRCELAKTRRQSVFSGQPVVTTPATELRCLVIAESPSENDEFEGRLLSDQHGQLLSAMLSSIGWGDEAHSVWTSLVKCRPQGIAVASAQQISACSPYLLAQIQQLKPKVIITLGTLAAQSLLETSASLAELSSKVHFYRDYPVVTLAHPAYLQRHPQAKAAAWQALLRAKALVI
jgi:DNA polymerase